MFIPVFVSLILLFLVLQPVPFRMLGALVAPSEPPGNQNDQGCVNNKEHCIIRVNQCSLFTWTVVMLVAAFLLKLLKGCSPDSAWVPAVSATENWSPKFFKMERILCPHYTRCDTTYRHVPGVKPIRWKVLKICIPHTGRNLELAFVLLSQILYFLTDLCLLCFSHMPFQVVEYWRAH